MSHHHLEDKLEKKQGLDRVRVLKSNVFDDSDSRRTITDYTFPRGINTDLGQVKVIRCRRTGDNDALGNHYHTVKSGRWEYFMVGAGEYVDIIFTLKYRTGEGEITEVELMKGDTVIIPPGWSHTFIPRQEGATLLGVSNLPYDPDDDVEDKLV